MPPGRRESRIAEGDRYGRLLVVRVGEMTRSGRIVSCLCDCGVEKPAIYASHLRSGATRSCGCIAKEPKSAECRARMSLCGRTRPLSLKRAPSVVGDVVHIPLTRGQTAIVDLADAEVGQINWNASRTRIGKWYAVRQGRRFGQSGTLPLHRLIATRAGLVIEGKEVDHIDGDGLNCRRSNLRPASRGENKQNQGPNSRNTSGHKGVSWYKGAWVAEISVNNRKMYLGRFANIDDAIRVYADAACQYHGEFARTT